MFIGLQPNCENKIDSKIKYTLDNKIGLLWRTQKVLQQLSASVFEHHETCHAAIRNGAG
jgi:hypothetical protein